MPDTSEDDGPAVEPERAQPASASPVMARRRRTALIITAAAILAAATAGTVLAVSGSPARTPPVRAPHQDRALTAARRLAAKVATVTSTFSVQISGPFSAAETGTLVLELRPLRIQASLTLTAYGQSGALTEITTASAVYLQSASMFDSTSSRPWAVIRSGTLNPRTVFADLLPGAQTADPIAQYLLALHAQQLRAAGEQMVAGTDAARYAGFYSPRSPLRYLPASVRGGVAMDLKQVHGNVAFSLWIDRHNEIRQISQTQELTTGAAGLPPLVVSETCTITSLNQPVHITVPPPGEQFTPPPSQINGTAL